jgi:hypothetical protein
VVGEEEDMDPAPEERPETEINFLMNESRSLFLSPLIFGGVLSTTS